MSGGDVVKESEKRARAADAVYRAHEGTISRDELLDTFGRLTGRNIWDAATATPEELEASYTAIADEVNDGSPDDCTLDDLDEFSVGKARIFAASRDLPWPPGVGDFDRYYETRRAP